MAKASAYVALRRFHHPGGVAFPGEPVTLDDKQAERALRLGDVRVAAPKPAPVKTSEESE